MQDHKNSKNRARGREAEEIAANKLIEKGYSILHMGYQSGHLEIDIIAKKMINQDEILCFIECKYRQVKSALHREMAFASVGISKQKKLVCAAKIFLSRYPRWKNAFCRFDVVVLLREKNNSTVQIHHFENAFTEI